MTAEIKPFLTRSSDALTAARALRDEARDAAISLAEQLVEDAAKLSERLAEASKIDTMPAGIRDVLLKLSMELTSRVTSANQIAGNFR